MSASSGARRHREDVVEDLAGVGEHRGAHPPDVGHRAATPRTAPGVANGTSALQRADASPVNSELEWKNGSGAYTAVARPELGDALRRARRCAAKRPCVQRTAFGKPVDPDVKISR